MTDDDRPGMPERYAMATRSGNLTPRLRGVTDADVLLAAGIAASGDPHLRLALQLYRIAVSGDRSDLPEVTQSMVFWLKGQLSRGGQRPIRTSVLRAVCVETIVWWLNQTCNYCEGRGFESIEEASRLSAVPCNVCHGTGKKALRRAVAPTHYDEAALIAAELDRAVTTIHARMCRLLAVKLDL
jgi:hypothetical protein